jgi:hypothetical protein
MLRFLLASVFFTFCSLSFCQPPGFGLGLIVGDPTGISAKLDFKDNTAIDGAVAWDLAGGNNAMLIHADFLTYKRLIQKKEQLNGYLGFGSRVIFLHDLHVAARVPVGLSYFLKDISVETFFEVVPIIKVLPTQGADIDAAIGIRYNF